MLMHTSPLYSGRYAQVSTRCFEVPIHGGKIVSMLIPIADMVNHCSFVRGSWRLEPQSTGGDGDAVVFFAGKPFKKGTEVCHSYS